MSTLNISYFIEDRKDISKLFSFASGPGVLVNTQWLELPKSITNFHGPGQNCLRHRFDCIVWTKPWTVCFVCWFEPRHANCDDVIGHMRTARAHFRLHSCTVLSGPSLYSYKITVNPLYTDTRYNDMSRYNSNLTGTKLSHKRWQLIRKYARKMH